VTVTEIIKEKNRVRLETICTVAGKRVLEGEAIVLAVGRPQS
jgi:3-hydroxybutyryl-CoA dehydratase